MADYVTRYTDAQAKAYAKRLREVYAQAGKEVAAKAQAFLARHQAKAAKLLQDVSGGKLDIADYRAWLRGQVFQGDRWQQRLKDIVRVFTKADDIAREMLGGTLFNVFIEAANFIAYSIEGDLRGAVSFQLYDHKTVERLILQDPKVLPEWRIDQPKDYIWNQQRVQNAITQAVIQGEPIPQIGQRLGVELATGNERKMELFARTAMTGAQNAGRIERLHEAEELGVDVRKKWLAARDDRVRETHEYLDGQERRIDEPFEVDGMEIDYPGDPDAAPELVYNCRCTMVYVYPKYQPQHVWHKTESFAEWKRGKKATDDDD